MLNNQNSLHQFIGKGQEFSQSGRFLNFDCYLFKDVHNYQSVLLTTLVVPLLGSLSYVKIEKPIMLGIKTGFELF